MATVSFYINNDSNPLLEGFVLEQKYPNPFNPETVIGYQAPANSEVSLIIYNVAGREVRTLINYQNAADNERITWDGRKGEGKPAPSGVYLYRLIVGNNFKVKTMTFVR
ncbi:MAG: T9SS type A sorting domain-containing protein [Calditrichota bacterium]